MKTRAIARDLPENAGSGYSAEVPPGHSLKGTMPERAEAVMERSVLDVVFGQTGINALISPMVGVLVCGSLWKAGDHRRLLIWLGALVVIMMIRYAAVFLFRRHSGTSETRVWNLVFSGTLVLASMVWGVGALFIVPTASELHETVVYVFLLGMACGSALGYSALQPAAISALIIILGPDTLKFFLTPDATFHWLAATGILMIIVSTGAIMRLGGFIRRSFEYSYELDSARKMAEHQARIDELTGLHNRRAFYELGEYLISQARRLNYPLSILHIDVDHFKQINDSSGHAAGDAVLRSLAGTMRQTCRAADIAGRLGGDEFAILLPGDGIDNALTFAARLRSAFARSKGMPDGLKVEVTCSIGAAVLTENMDLDQILHVADIALYNSKRSGRDQVSH